MLVYIISFYINREVDKYINASIKRNKTYAYIYIYIICACIYNLFL